MTLINEATQFKEIKNCEIIHDYEEAKVNDPEDP